MSVSTTKRMAVNDAIRFLESFGFEGYYDEQRLYVRHDDCLGHDIHDLSEEDGYVEMPSIFKLNFLKDALVEELKSSNDIYNIDNSDDTLDLSGMEIIISDDNEIGVPY